MLRVEMLTHALYRHLLIMAVGDIVLNAEVGYVVSLAFLDEEFKVALSVERIEPTRGIAQPVDDIGLEAVGIIYYRPYAIALFEAAGIELGLVLALYG